MTGKEQPELNPNLTAPLSFRQSRSSTGLVHFTADWHAAKHGHPRLVRPVLRGMASLLVLSDRSGDVLHNLPRKNRSEEKRQAHDRRVRLFGSYLHARPAVYKPNAACILYQLDDKGKTACGLFVIIR